MTIKRYWRLSAQGWHLGAAPKQVEVELALTQYQGQ